MTMHERLTSHLLRLTTLLAEATGRTPWATLNRLTGKGNLLASLETGSGNSFLVSTYDEILQAYSTYWPSGLDWPSDIERPAPQRLVVDTSAQLAPAAAE